MQVKKKADQLWLLPTEGATGHTLVADVALRLRTHDVHRYAVPKEQIEKLRPGLVVDVPYGRGGRIVEGWCVGLAEGEWDHTLKAIKSTSDGMPLLSPELIELALWISRYYAHPPGWVLDVLVPSALRNSRPKQIQCFRAVPGASQQQVTDKQRTVLALLPTEQSVPRAELRASAGVSDATLRTMVKRGLIEIVLETMPPEAPAVGTHTPTAADSFSLTDGQQSALEAIARVSIEKPKFGVLLLFGVPGSGKTEVYVRAIRRVIAERRQAILLVPEIALATQIVDRLARRFERVAVLHSRLTARMRRETLRAIADGLVDVVIGTRTAVFAPCPRLGLIVVDEEQEGSFKNLAAPFYHARDVAIKRGQIEKIPVVLGSATPALETWHNAAARKHFQVLRLPERVPGASFPTVRVVETSEPELGRTTSLLCRELIQRIKETVAGGGQAIVLHNRRGYAVHLKCIACGLAVQCEHCGALLVFHRADNRMKCHRCGRRSDVPQRCLDDSCGGQLERSGLAIQRLEQELKRVVPTARILRLDSDTMQHREDYAAALHRFESGEADILLGTQMVAKGLDFPEVRLVGVIGIDAQLRLPDFRATEHVLQLLMQVFGRAGRREGDSLALLQTSEPQTPAIRAAADMDYEAFAEEELSNREALFLPPFSRMVRIICADAMPARARDAAESLADALRKLAGRIHAEMRVEDAEPCVVPRLRDLHRYQVIVFAPRQVGVTSLLATARSEKLFNLKVKRLTIDVDPIDLL